MTRLRNVFVVAAMATLFVGCGGSSTTDDDESMVEDEPTASSPETPSGPTTPPATAPPATVPPATVPPVAVLPQEEEEEDQATRGQVMVLEARKAISGLERGADTTLGPLNMTTVDNIYNFRAPVTVNAEHTVDDVAATVPFPSGNRPTAGGGWSVTTLKARDGVEHDFDMFEHTIVVYTDIEGPTSTPMDEVSAYSTFDTVYVVERDTDGDNDADEDDNLDVAFVVTADGAGRPRFTDTRTLGELMAISSFPTNENEEEYELVVDSNRVDDMPAVPSTLVKNQTRNIPGTLDGARGNFFCRRTEGECTLERFEGHYTFGEGDMWYFSPANGARVQVEDESYMTFGWWKRENHDGDVEFLNFSSGKVRADPGLDAGDRTFVALAGTATYEGPAVGHYAIHQPAGENAAGAFEATARLDADFDDEMLSGTIDRFDVDLDWSLTLNEVGLNDSGGVVGDEGTVEWDNGTSVYEAGKWSAQFLLQRG